MTEQQEPQDNQWSKDRDDWRAEKRQWREERRAMRRNGAPWVLGLILIIVGGALLLQNLNFNLPFLRNWWALFILIPAVPMLINAWEEYQDAQAFTRRARGLLTGGLFLTVLAFAFLFGISSPFFWPGMLILAGVAVLLNGFVR
jgi:protein-S-isoprenylcysteine O-methyltransferase Ste14